MNLGQSYRYLRRAVRSLLPAKPAAGHSHAHPTYSDAELLARAEEFNRNAERHWAATATEAAGREHVLNKPLSTVRDTPGILYRLGLVLNELDLGVGQTVLDFGAGSCWLSSILNRLRCRTVAIDVSPSALALGEELFRLDPRHRLDLEPRFLPYDGHRIPLPDAAVDRIVCFDAFHHVPNQDEVLAEMCRVLRPGGRAVMAEPGEGHAHLEQSVYETEKAGVLENDIHLDDLVARARRAGFDRFALKPYPDAALFTFPLETYEAFMAGDDTLFPVHLLRNNLRHFHVLTLGKGEPVIDSRNPRTLRARIERADAQVVRGAAGQVFRLALRAENTGDTLWLQELEPIGGFVSLAGHLLNERRELLVRGWARTALPRSVPPGESVDLVLELPLPEQKGRYVVQLDMVDEYVAWFEQCGSPTIDIAVEVDAWPDSRKPHRLAAALEIAGPGLPARARPGAPLAARVRLTNTGDTVWHQGPAGEAGVVFLGGHLLDSGGSLLDWDFFRAPLARAVSPGESLEIEAAFAAPPEAGRYRLRLDLMADGVCWFEQFGSPTPELALETTGETPDSASPGLLRAELARVGGEAALLGAAGARLALRLRLRNAGNTLWLSSPEKRHGHVAVGGHLLDAEGRLLDRDFLRVPLPTDVAPGATIEVDCPVLAPPAPGRYLLELDMVDEGVAWFGPRGSATLRVPLDVA